MIRYRKCLCHPFYKLYWVLNWRTPLRRSIKRISTYFLLFFRSSIHAYHILSSFLFNILTFLFGWFFSNRHNDAFSILGNMSHLLFCGAQRKKERIFGQFKSYKRALIVIKIRHRKIFMEQRKYWKNLIFLSRSIGQDFSFLVAFVLVDWNNCSKYTIKWYLFVF